MASNVTSEQETEGEASLQSNFEAQRNKLQVIVQSEFGLLSKLRSSKVLSVTDQQTINADKTTIGRNQKLLEIIFERGKYHEFIDALQKSGQTHVVNWINGNGVYRPEFVLDWPLTEREIEILDSNYDQLGEILNVKEELIRILFTKFVINERQKDFISSKFTSCEANEAFLDILRQSSLKAYFLTVQCLRDLNEVRAANILDKVTIAVPVHVNIGGENVSEVEKQLVKKLTLMCLEDTASFDTADLDKILAWLRVSVVSAKKGSSIVLFVSCCTVDEFRQLCTIVDNDDITKVLEKLFNQLLQNFLSKVLLARITEADREKAEKLFHCELLRDKKYDDHFQQLRSQLKYEEPMEVTTTEESIEDSNEEELLQESDGPSTSASVEDEKQEDLVQQLAESRMQPEAEKYSFHDARMDLKKEKDSYGISRMDWEKEKEELIRSLHLSHQADLKKEKDSYEKSKIDWEKERKALIRSLHMSQSDLSKEKEKSRMDWEKEKKAFIRSLHMSQSDPSKENETKKRKRSLSKSGEESVGDEERSAEPRSQTEMEDFPLEMLDMILLKTVRRMMAMNSSEAFKSFDELMYHVLNHLRTISLLWDSRLHAKWVKIQLRRLRNTSKERDHKTKKSILDCYAVFVKDVELSAVRVLLILFKVAKRQKLNDIFNKSSNSQSRCRAFLDHLFIEGHPLAFLAMKQLLDGIKADILDYMDGRKTCTMTEEGSKFLSNDEIKVIVSTEDIYDQLMADLDPDRLGDLLKQERVITIKEWQETIAPLENIKDRRHSTLDYLSTISHPRAYIILRQVLIQDNSKIASAIDNATSEAEKKYDIRNQITKHREFLMERMDSEFGLLHRLSANSVLTIPELGEIETENTHRRRNGRLLDCVLNNSSKDSADLFIEALKETGQGHLVNYMISDGVYDSKFADEWPLTEKDFQNIDSNYEVIIRLLDTDGLLTMLCATGVINSKQRDFISSKPTSRKRNEGFLEVLRKTSLRDYKETIRCLRKSKQNRIATILETGEDNIVELENNLHKTREFLEEIIDADFGLIDKLRSKGVLSIKEVQHIKAENTSLQRNSLLLETILKNKKIPQLCESLKDTGQQHIVNYIKACGERSPQFGDDWPLTEKEISILESNHEALIDILDTCDLIGRLYLNGALNRRHLEFISSRSTSYEKSEALLEILRRSSLRSYAQTIKCLRQSNQNHIAKILETGGVIVPVHATLETENLNETEEQIVDKMANFLLQSNTTPEQANRLMAATQLKIIAGKRGQ